MNLRNCEMEGYGVENFLSMCYGFMTMTYTQKMQEFTEQDRENALEWLEHMVSDLDLERMPEIKKNVETICKSLLGEDNVPEKFKSQPSPG